MVAALAANTTSPKAHQSVTITGTGFAATTDYTLLIKYPSSTGKVSVTSNGSGGFAVTVVAPEAGALTVEARPTAEHNGTTAALVSLSTIKWQVND